LTIYPLEDLFLLMQPVNPMFILREPVLPDGYDTRTLASFQIRSMSVILAP